MRPRFLDLTGLPGLFAITTLAIAALTRLVLTIVTRHELDGPIEAIAPFAIGLLYDCVVAAFWLAPLLCLRALLPRRLLATRAFTALAWLLLFAGIYIQLFQAVAEWLFWDEFSTRFNFIAVDYLVYRREVTDNILESYPVYPLLATLALVDFATVALLFARTRPRTVPNWRPRLITAAVAAVIAVACALLPLDKPRELFGNRYAQELAGNGTFEFFKAFRRNELDYHSFYAARSNQRVSDVLQQLLPAGDETLRERFDIAREVRAAKPAQPRNVIMVVVESLSAKYLGSYGSNEGLTPELDRLAAQSLQFDRLYATGTRTVRGLEALTLSIPPTPGMSIVKRPDNENLFSIGSVFRQHGYRTRFFYGGFGYFDNMNYFFGNNGFEIHDRASMSANEIHFANAWGVADEDVFARVIREASSSHRTGQPFFSLVMTTSNHRPYTYPEGRIDLPSGSGREGAVKYTDYALGRLIAEARKQPWFNDTLFVIVADHCAGVAGKTALPVDRYHIPMLFYAPAFVAPGHVTTLASQIDVAPTVLGLLQLPYRSQFFGQDIFAIAPQDQRALIANYQELGLWKNDVLTILEPGKSVLQQPQPELQREPQSTVLDPRLVEETIAYYQGADYIWTHRLNRQHPADGPAAQVADSAPPRRKKSS